MSAPLIILALDTGDPESIDRWARAGHLPTIAAIRKRGAWGTTGGPEMICEYGVSLTLFSGVSRRDHGYYYARQLVPGTYDLAVTRPPIEAAPPFWACLGETGERVLIIDVPDARPVPGVAGIQLANWATHHGKVYGAEAEPPEILEQVRQRFGPGIPMHAEHDATPTRDREIRDRLLARLRRKGDLARALFDRGHFEVVVIFFSETDPASHQFWKYRDAGPHEPLRHAIREIHTAIDAEMGKILGKLPRSNVVILSLYGIQDEYPTSSLTESFLSELGYHVEGGGNGAAGRKLDPLALARRILPDGARRAIGRRLGAKTQERLIAARLRDATDWGRTSAFAIPSLFTGFVRINLRGREPRGVVETGVEYEAVLRRIEDDLRLLTDADTGAPAVRRVARATELFGGGPPEKIPDLFIEWEPGPRMLTRVRHPRATLVQPRPAYCPDSQERLTGFIAAAGSDVPQSGGIGEIDLLDLAPTFLALRGRRPPAVMHGRPVDALLRA